jgi:hypothetical protein
MPGVDGSFITDPEQLMAIAIIAIIRIKSRFECFNMIEPPREPRFFSWTEHRFSG